MLLTVAVTELPSSDLFSTEPAAESVADSPPPHATPLDLLGGHPRSCFLWAAPSQWLSKVEVLETSHSCQIKDSSPEQLCLKDFHQSDWNFLRNMLYSLILYLSSQFHPISNSTLPFSFHRKPMILDFSVVTRENGTLDGQEFQLRIWRKETMGPLSRKIHEHTQQTLAYVSGGFTHALNPSCDTAQNSPPWIPRWIAITGLLCFLKAWMPEANC